MLLAQGMVVAAREACGLVFAPAMDGIVQLSLCVATAMAGGVS